MTLQHEDKTQRYTNRLIHESSPYLIQHAHNPVDWYPWGKDALAIAQAEDKPILLSIGYAACHWCHILAKESFENEDTARRCHKLFAGIGTCHTQLKARRTKEGPPSERASVDLRCEAN